MQIDCLCRILGGLTDKTCFVGIAHVLVQLKRDRERLQKQVVKAVKRLRAKGVLREMRRTTGKTLRRLAASPQNLPTPAALAKARRQVAGRLAAVLERQHSLADFEDRAGHHALRIEVKRLRYTMEICRPLYGGRLDGQIEAVKRLQTLLGEIHDCDVWFGHLDEFAARQQERIAAMFGHTAGFNRLKPGIDFLQADRRRHREQTFQELVGYWSELGHRRLWDELTSTVALAGGEPMPGQPPRAAGAKRPDAASAGEDTGGESDQTSPGGDRVPPAGERSAPGGNGHPASGSAETSRLAGERGPQDA